MRKRRFPPPTVRGMVASRLLPVLAVLLGSSVEQVCALELRLEAGPTEAIVNQLQRPKTTDGSRFDAHGLAGRQLTPWRLDASWADCWWGRDGEWRAVIAPLRQSGTRIAGSDLRFDGATFAAGQPLALRYQFDTWRLAYTEPFGSAWSGRWQWRLGGELAIRSARILLRQGAVARDFNNVGPVPLARLETSVPVDDRQRVEATLEGFPAPGGGGLFDGSARWIWRVASGASMGLYFREEAGAAVGSALLNRLHTRSWGMTVNGDF